jgi:hypothetical protein
MRSLIAGFVSGLVMIGGAFGAGELLCMAVVALTGIPDPVVHASLGLIILAFAAPLVVSVLSASPSPDLLLRLLVLPPALAVAASPVLIERAHHQAGFGVFEERLQFQELPLYGNPLVVLGVVTILAILPTWRMWHLSR